MLWTVCGCDISISHYVDEQNSAKLISFFLPHSVPLVPLSPVTVCHGGVLETNWMQKQTRKNKISFAPFDRLQHTADTITLRFSHILKVVSLNHQLWCPSTDARTKAACPIDPNESHSLRLTAPHASPLLLCHTHRLSLHDGLHNGLWWIIKLAFPHKRANSRCLCSVHRLCLAVLWLTTGGDGHFTVLQSERIQSVAHLHYVICLTPGSHCELWWK